MIYGISAKVLSSRTNMHASLLETFPDIRGSSLIGAGDEEMTRDKHTVFPGATGGYADWYVATTRQLQTATYTLEHFRLLPQTTACRQSWSQKLPSLCKEKLGCRKSECGILHVKCLFQQAKRVSGRVRSLYVVQ